MPDGDQSRWLSYQELNELRDGARVRGEIGKQHELKLAADTDALSVLRAIQETVETLIAPIREQQERDRERAESAERELEGLQADLVKARIEAAGLRCQLEKARSNLSRRWSDRSTTSPDRDPVAPWR